MAVTNFVAASACALALTVVASLIFAVVDRGCWWGYFWKGVFATVLLISLLLDGAPNAALALFAWCWHENMRIQ